MPLLHNGVALQPRFQRETGMMGKDKRLESYLTFPANLSQISIIVHKLQMNGPNVDVWRARCVSPGNVPRQGLWATFNAATQCN